MPSVESERDALTKRIKYRRDLGFGLTIGGIVYFLRLIPVSSDWYSGLSDDGFGAVLSVFTAPVMAPLAILCGLCLIVPIGYWLVYFVWKTEEARKFEQKYGCKLTHERRKENETNT